MQIEPRDGEEVCVRGLWSEVFVCVCACLQLCAFNKANEDASADHSVGSGALEL
jgi:hypothetical protein